MTVADLDLHRPLPPRRVPEYTRPPVAATESVVWLQQEAEMSLVLPGENALIVLPWRTRMATHSAYVQDAERRLKVPWAGEHIEPARFSGKGKTTRFRYGNKLLGLAGTYPEHRDIAGLTYFSQQWNRDPTLQRVVSRKWMPFAKCTQCSLYRQLEVSRFKRDAKAKAKARDEHAEHLAEIKLESM